MFLNKRKGVSFGISMCLFRICLLLLAALPVRGQEPGLYEWNVIQKIEIFFAEPNWNQLLHTLKATTDGYLKADSVKINGTRFLNVGVKYKGNSTYNPSWMKNPFTIKLSKYQNQDYQGYDELKLSNGYHDPSMIREVLAYQLLSQIMECPRANFAKIWVNNYQMGLYTNVEDISKTFCANRFKSAKSNPFFKCNPLITPGPAVKSNLRYLGADSTLYQELYEMKSNLGWGKFLQLMQTVTQNPQQLDQILDMDRALWMLAFNNSIINLDSYSGAFAQNYFLFQDNQGRFNPIIWDLNMAFGGFPFSGSSNNSLGTLSIANMKVYHTHHHQNDPYWPLIVAVHSSPRWKKMYHAHIRDFTEAYFFQPRYDSLAQALMAIADTALASDTNKFFSYTQFQHALESDISVGNYLVPGIRSLMQARTSFLASRPEISAQRPVIEQISASTVGLQVRLKAYFANVSDTAVFLGYRNSAAQKFTRVRMFDDGLHQDEAPGDGVFGAVVNIDPAGFQFYLYAENENAATFSPPLAEYRYFGLSTFMSAYPPKKSFGRAWNVFPNPAMDKVFFSYSDPGLACQNLRLTDMLGREQLKVEQFTGGDLDLRTLPGGIYLVSWGSSTGRLVLRP